MPQSRKLDHRDPDDHVAAPPRSRSALIGALPADVIAARRAAGERVKDLAAEFGVSSALISKHLKSARVST